MRSKRLLNSFIHLVSTKAYCASASSKAECQVLGSQQIKPSVGVGGLQPEAQVALPAGPSLSSFRQGPFSGSSTALIRAVRTGSETAGLSELTCSHLWSPRELQAQLPPEHYLPLCTAGSPCSCFAQLGTKTNK